MCRCSSTSAGRSGAEGSDETVIDWVGGGERRYVDFVAEDTGDVDESVADALFDHFFLHSLADDVGLGVTVLLDEVPNHHRHRIVRREGGKGESERI